MDQSAVVIADSVWEGHRIVTWHLKVWKPLVAQMNKHRLGAQSTASSRAMSLGMTIKQVDEDPFVPVLTRNGKGMGGERFVVGSVPELTAHTLWLTAAHDAAKMAKNMRTYEISKEVANRILEPFLVVDMVVTFEGHYLEKVFFPLRLAKDAQPDMQALAGMMRDSMAASVPKETRDHAPWGILDVFACASACARASYGGAGVVRPDDVQRGEKLRADKHWSPFEHSCVAGQGSRQFRYWVCSRELLELPLWHGIG
jgi:hypothetical protein